MSTLPASSEPSAASDENATALKLTFQLAYQCKLAADQGFIRRDQTISSKLKPTAKACGNDVSFTDPAGAKGDDATLQCDGLASRLSHIKGVAGQVAAAFEARCVRVNALIGDPAERFRRDAFALYLDAFATLRDMAKDLTNARDATVAEKFALLGKDIEFRTELLSINEDFWGGAGSSVPSIPPLHLAAMRSLLDQLEAVATEIRQIEGRLDDKELKGLELTSQAEAAHGDIEASLPTGDKINLMQRQAEQRVASATAQIGLVKTRQMKIQNEQSQLAAQIDSLNADLNKALISAVGNYLGVPPEIQSIAEGGSAEAAFKSYVGAKAGEILADPEVLSAFGEMGQTAAKYAQTIHEAKAEVEGYAKDVQEVRDTVEKGKLYVEELKSVIREPTVANLTRIGARVLEKVDPAALAQMRSGFCDVVARQKPIAAMLEQARDPRALVSGKIREGVLGGLRALPGSRVRFRGYLHDAISEVSPSRRAAWLADLLERGGSYGMSTGQADAVLSRLARIAAGLWPRTIIERMPAQHRQRLMADLRRSFGIGSEEELIDRMDKVAVPRIAVRAGTVAITVGNTVYPVATWTEISRAISTARSFEADAGKVQARLEEAVSLLADDEALRDTISKELIGQIPFGTLEGEVERIRGDATKVQVVWNRALTSTGESIGADCQPVAGGAVEQLVQLEVGSRTAGEIAKSREAAVKLEGGGVPSAPDASGAPTPGTGGDPKDELAKEIALRALDATFPPSGAVAGLALKVWSSFQETAELSRKMSALSEESNRLIQTELQLHAAVDAARVALEVGRLDGELADLKRSTALAQYDALTHAAQAAGAQTLVGLAQIQRRQPLVFYLAEKLRQEYDELDRSISLWGPSGGTVRDAIRQLVREDPQNIRLALDSDIQLYEWLDRSDETVRTDTDRIVSHWRQLFRLVSDTCDKIGCQPGATRLGQVQQTAMVDVCVLMDREDCQSFRAWLAGDRTQTPAFSASFTFPADGGLMPDHLLNVRVIDLRLGGFRRTVAGASTRAPLRLNTLQASHPGFSFIRQSGGWTRETAAPGETASFDWPDAFDIEELGKRWNAGSRPSRRFFEGYGLVATWRLAATWAPSLADLDRDAVSPDGPPTPPELRSGVFIRVAYSYHLPPPGAHEAQAFVSRSDAGTGPDQLVRPILRLAGSARQDLRTIEVNPGTLMMIGASPAFFTAQKAWADPSGKPGAAQGDCSAGAHAGPDGFVASICLDRISEIATEALVRDQARDLVASCMPEADQVRRKTGTASRREIDHILATRYGPPSRAAATLIERSLRIKVAAGPVAVCKSTFTSTLGLCDAIRSGAFAGCVR